MLKSAIISFALYHGLCLTPAIFGYRKTWIEDWSRPAPKRYLHLAWQSAIFCVFVLVLYHFAGRFLLSSSNAVQVLTRSGYSKIVIIPMSIYFCTINPAMEEIFWRGIILNRLTQMELPWKHFPLVWSSVAYAAFHYPLFKAILYPGWAEFGIFVLTIYGALSGYIYLRTKSLALIALVHALLPDLAAVCLVFTVMHDHGGF